MSYPISQKINPYAQQTSMGVNNNSNTPVVDANTITQGITQNSVLKGVSDNQEDGLFSMKTFLISLPIWIGMCFGMDKFNQGCRNQEGKTNLLNKIAETGDKITKKFPFIETLIEKTQLAKKNFMKDFVTPKHPLFYSLFKTPAKPENSQAISTTRGPIAEVASEAAQKLEKYKAKSGDILLDGKPVDFVDLTKNAHTEDNIKKIIKICDSMKDKSFKLEQAGKIPLSKKITGSEKYLSEILPKFISNTLFKKEIYFSEYANKLKAMRLEIPAESKLGALLPRTVFRAISGIVQGSGGSKIGILMAAYFVGEAVKKGIEAKGPGEKHKTFIENFVYNTSWFLTMPLAAAIMYHVGGLKYIGMKLAKDLPKDQEAKSIEGFRTKLTEFNNKRFNNQNDYNTAKAEIKALLKADTGSKIKNVIYSPLKAFGRIWDVGLERINPYIRKDAGKMEEFFKTLPNNLKRGTGFALRFGLFMFAISPFLAKICAQASDGIFGKPKKSVLDEDKESEKELPPLTIPKQDATPKLVQATQPSQTLQPTQPIQQNTNLNDNQMISTPNQNIANSYASQRDIISNPQEPVRRYIPSSEPVEIREVLTDEQKKNINKALAKSETSESISQKRLKKKD